MTSDWFSHRMETASWLACRKRTVSAGLYYGGILDGRANVYVLHVLPQAQRLGIGRATGTLTQVIKNHNTRLENKLSSLVTVG